jgi:hypothetical protein
MTGIEGPAVEGSDSGGGGGGGSGLVATFQGIYEFTGSTSDELIVQKRFAGALLDSVSNTQLIDDAWTTLANFQLSNRRGELTWFSSSNPSRITIPEGITEVQFFAGVMIDSDNNTGVRGVRLRKNGSDITFDGNITLRYTQGIGGFFPFPIFDTSRSFQTSRIEVSEGDYFEVQCYQSGGNNNTFAIVSPQTYFAVKATGFARR